MDSAEAATVEELAPREAQAPRRATAARPRYRGTSHLYAFFVSLVTGPVLVGLASGPEAKLLAAGYAFSLSYLLGVSGAYHIVHWSYGPRTLMRRLDHAGIFVLIAGTSSPFALALPEDRRPLYLGMVLLASTAGVVRAVVWPYAPKWVTSGTGLVIGWGIACFLPQMTGVFGGDILSWVIIGGAIYTAGSICYALKAPNFWPKTFGYHEVFHALTLVGAAMHYVAIARVVTSVVH